MTTSTWWQVATAVRDVLAGDTGFRLPGSGDNGCTVYVATQVHLEDEDGDYVVIAWPGDPDRETSPGGFEQKFGPLAATAGRPRDETGRIACRVVAQDGDSDPEDTVSRAMGYLGQLETVLRADPTIGLVPALQRVVVEVQSAEVLPFVNRGAVVPIDVVLSYSARI